MVRMFCAAAVAVATFPVLNVQAIAAPRPVQCVITNDYDGVLLKGPCLFEADRDGSFVLNPAHGRYLIQPNEDGDPGILFVSLDVETPGIGEVRGMTSDGFNSRWGPVARSESDRACWVGEDFRVCVY